MGGTTRVEARTPRLPMVEDVGALAEAGVALGGRVALAHDYLSERGGAERVVVSLTRAFPDAPLYTSVLDAAMYTDLAGVDVRTSMLNRVGPLRRRHRIALPMLPTAFARLTVDADVVVCSSSGWAHGISTEGRKVVYCHNPPRWLYQRDHYVAGKKRYYAAGLLLDPYLRRWDQRAARTCHRYIANSSAVAHRIRAAYGIDAEVLPPPTSLDVAGAREPIAGVEPGFVVCVARLMRYKNVEQVAEGFRLVPGHRLVVVGDGPQLGELRAKAPANVTYVGRISDAQLRWAYANCIGLVSASFEDFGLTPVEVGLFGKPSALLHWGGFLDTTIEGTTGVFFQEPQPRAIADAVLLMLAERWSSARIAMAARRFSEVGFTRRLHEIVAEELGSGRAVAA
jgi:glycosyltransferase involved in cell wall biosynthesis